VKENWCRYGPLDKIPLAEVAQTGAAGIVNALHEGPYGEIWCREAIAHRNGEIIAGGFERVVVESLPIPAAAPIRAAR
jgi:mannonate dehydratase